MQPSPYQRPHSRYPGPTRFAKKYGHPKGGVHATLEDYLPEVKSGLTPVTPKEFLENQGLRDNAEDLELYQRMRFCGFTAAELESVLALPDSKETTSRRISYGKNLDDVPIHPLYDRSNWQHELPRHFAKYPFGDGHEYWEAKNDAVWRAMEPGLKLASSVIANANTWEWYNSLLKGPWERVPDDELSFKTKHDLFRFFPREDRKDKKLEAHTRDMFRKLADKTYFALSGAKCHNTGIPIAYTFEGGVTSWYPRRGSTPGSLTVPDCTIVLVAHDMIMPLLNPEALPEDRALDIFRFADTVLHETAHAMVHQVSRTYQVAIDWGWNEPYYENEPIPEAGFSAINQIFGGVPAPVVDHADLPGFSCGGIIQYNWPTYRHAKYVPHAPTLPTSRQKDWDDIKFYPVPVAYFMSLQSREFWDIYVRKFGSKAAHMGPKIVGLSVKKSDDGVRKGIILRDTNIPVPTDKPGVFSRKKTKIAHSFEIERRRAIRMITTASKTVNPRLQDPIWADGERDFQKFIGPADRADPVQMNCPRYDEIRMYLERNKFVLAIHTMDFNMPAHVFRSYINRLGGINLTNLEWKTFLLVANTRNELFYYSHSGYGVILINDNGWMQIPPPQTNLRRNPLPPEKQVLDIFDYMMRLFLQDLNLEAETKDIDTEYLKYWINVFWKLEINRGEHNDLLIHPKMPEGFTWDPEGDALFDACIHHSDLFVDAPFNQGLARRADVLAPGTLPKKRKTVHDSLIIGDPVRLGPEDLLGDPIPSQPGGKRTPSPTPPPLPPRPIIGGFGAGWKNPTEVGTGAGAGGEQIYKPYRAPGVDDSQPPSPENVTGRTSIEEHFENLGWGQPSTEGVKPKQARPRL